MQNRQRNFAETGAASSVLALKEDLGLDFVGNDQLEITPFQRQVFEAEKSRQTREKEKKMEEARNGAGGAGGGRTPNSLNNQSPPGAGAGNSSGQTETIRYVNEGDSTDSDDGTETLSVID